MRNRFWAVYIFCSAMGMSLLWACNVDFGKTPQHSTPALDSLLADTMLVGEEANFPTNEAEEAAPLNTKPAKITMQNDLDYSADFLKKLTYAGLAENIELADSFLILEGKDTVVFPILLPKSDWTNFVASKGGYLYSLDVSRVNYTTIDFNFELRKSRQSVDQIRGKADLNPGFVLGGEIDEDSVTSSSYFVTEYHFESPECSFSIRIGEDGGVKKVKLVKQCKTGKFNINLEDCPVLLEK